MEDLILRELSEISPHPPDKTNREDWWCHQKKQFIHRRLFDDSNENIEFLLSLDADMVYFVTQLWQSLEDEDWDQWQYALKKLAERYDDRLEKFGRKGKIWSALGAWQTLYRLYHPLDETTISSQSSD
jgi:hypothetical protein